MKRLALALVLTLAPVVAQEHGHAAPEAGHGAPAAAHGEGHGEEGGHSGLGVWKWVNFAILAGLLGWAIAKNAGPFFQGRIAEIQKDINEAREVKAEADARAAAIEKRLANLDSELATLRSDARREMESEAARIQDETKRIVARSGEQAEQEIASLAKAAETELRRETSRLALGLAEQKLKARMSPEAEQALAERFVSGLGSVSRN